jgi:hypothetical protein
MKPTAILILGIIFAALAMIILSLVILDQPFPVANYSNSSLVDITQNIGSEDSRFLWNNTGLALIAQAFVLFAAAAATLCLLKIDEEKL